MQDPPVKQKPFFRHDPFTTIFLAIFIFIASQLIAAIVISLYPAISNFSESKSIDWLTNSPVSQFAALLITSVALIYSVIKLLNWAQVKLHRVGLVKPMPRDAGYALVAYGLYFITYLAVIIIASNLLSGLNLDQEQKTGFQAAYSTAELIMAFVSLVVLPPLAEEFLFRGFIFSSLRAKYKLSTSIIITSVLFGVLHLQFGSGAPLLWVAAIDTFILSCYLCYLREKTGSLWSPILLHAIKNSVAFIVLFGSRIF